MSLQGHQPLLISRDYVMVMPDSALASHQSLTLSQIADLRLAASRSVEKLGHLYPVTLSHYNQLIWLLTLTTQGKSRSQGCGLYSRGMPQETWREPDRVRQLLDGGLWDSSAPVSQGGAV
jgi:hypothetical protein